MPSVVSEGFSGGSQEPRGWVYVASPVRLVGEVWFLVRPYTLLSNSITTMSML
jgi:hypothetical protein